VLQCAAGCCSILQYVAFCYSILQCVAVCCSVLQCVAVCCNSPTAASPSHRLLFSSPTISLSPLHAECSNVKPSRINVPRTPHTDHSRTLHILINQISPPGCVTIFSFEFHRSFHINAPRTPLMNQSRTHHIRTSHDFSIWMSGKLFHVNETDLPLQYANESRTPQLIYMPNQHTTSQMSETDLLSNIQMSHELLN